MVIKRKAVSEEAAEQAQEALIGIKITKTPLWITIHSMGFRQEAPSGNHAGADKEKQNAFKKIDEQADAEPTKIALDLEMELVFIMINPIACSPGCAGRNSE